jgi:hypothetical protein
VDSFESAWLKWGRAVLHMQALEAEITRFVHETSGTPFGAFRTEYEARRHGFSMRVDRVDSLPPSWNVLLGDFANNLMCALDHLAWALVARGRASGLTEAQEARIYFPVTSSRTHYNNVVARMLPGVRRADRAKIRAVQPWLKGKRGVEWHCYSILKRIVSHDKHREIQGLWMLPKFRAMGVHRAHDCEVTSVKGTHALMELDAEVAFIRARKLGPSPRLQMAYEVSTLPVFHPHLELQTWMDISAVEVMRLLGQFSPPPETLMALGVNLDDLMAAVDTWNEHAEMWMHTKGVPRRVV